MSLCPLKWYKSRPWKVSVFIQNKDNNAGLLLGQLKDARVVNSTASLKQAPLHKREEVLCRPRSQNIGREDKYGEEEWGEKEIQVKHFQKNISHAIPAKEKEKKNNMKVEGNMDKWKGSQTDWLLYVYIDTYIAERPNSCRPSIIQEPFMLEYR